MGKYGTGCTTYTGKVMGVRHTPEGKWCTSWGDNDQTMYLGVQGCPTYIHAHTHVYTHVYIGARGGPQVNPLAPTKDTQRLRKHVSLVLERMSRGMRLLAPGEAVGSGAPAVGGLRPLYRDHSLADVPHAVPIPPIGPGLTVVTEDGAMLLDGAGGMSSLDPALTPGGGFSGAFGVGSGGEYLQRETSSALSDVGGPEYDR